MINKRKIMEEIQKQMENIKKIQETVNLTPNKKNYAKIENAKEILDSIEGTQQRKKLLDEMNIGDIYNQYLSEIEDTSKMIFPQEVSEKEKIINALEYMRLAVNKESEDISGIEKVNSSGINAGILGEGTAQSQNCYYRDLLNNQGIEATVMNTIYQVQDGKKAIKELVQVKTKEGNNLYIDPSEYNGSVESIEKYNNGEYKNRDFIQSLLQKLNLSGKSLPEGKITISQEEIDTSCKEINEQLIEKYQIREISQIAGIDSSNLVENQLKIIGLLGNNLTQIQGQNVETLRTVRMNDGKEMDVSKMLELFYDANGMEYKKHYGKEKEDTSFKFQQDGGLDYDINPETIFNKGQGSNIDTSALFIVEDQENAIKTLIGQQNSNKTLEECSKILQNKEKYTFMKIRDYNISNLQDNIQQNPKEIEKIRREEELKHYSIDDISNQLGIKDIMKESPMKAQCVLMAYLNENTYQYNQDGKQYQAIELSDKKIKFVPDVLEMFYDANGIEYRRDENNKLLFTCEGKEYQWEFDYNILLKETAIKKDAFANQKLVEAQSGEKVDISSLNNYSMDKIQGTIPLSQRIPTSTKEVKEMVGRRNNLEEELSKIPIITDGREDEQKYIYDKYENLAKQYYPKEYDTYLVEKGANREISEMSSEKIEKEYSKVVEEKASKLGNGCKTEKEKILTAMEYFRLNGRYENMLNSDDANIGSYLSQSAFSYAIEGEGVCSSQAYLLKDVLKEMGVNAGVESCNLNDNSKQIPVTYNSNHLINTVSLNEQKHVFDLTNYIGTKETLAMSDRYSVAQTDRKKSIEYSMYAQGNQDKSTEQTSKVQEILGIDVGLSAEIYPKIDLSTKINTPFGMKSLQELKFRPIEASDQEIKEARGRATEILTEELGIDHISEDLGLAKCKTDIEKQTKIMGYLENHLQKEESKEIRSRIVNIGGRSLEMSDAVELIYNYNKIDYEIEKRNNLSMNIDGEKVKLNASSIYKNDLTKEEEEGRIFQRSDGSYMDTSSSIKEASETIKKQEEETKSFRDNYKVNVESDEKEYARFLQQSKSKAIEEKKEPQKEEEEEYGLWSSATLDSRRN